jgi:hypothetical protein
MAVHIRRGDYKRACLGLAKHNSTFYQWNLLPELPDPLVMNFPHPADAKTREESDGGDSEGWENISTPKHAAMVRRRCWPSREEIVAKIMQAKWEWEGQWDGEPSSPRARRGGRENKMMMMERRKMNVIYVMTNGDEAWFGALKDQLMASGQWERVVSARELQLNPEQLGVAMAVDMDIGRRAGVFIGNGVRVFGLSGWKSVANVLLVPSFFFSSLPSGRRYRVTSFIED